MQIDKLIPSGSLPAMAPEQRRPNSPEEAARQFEEILVKQLLGTMTKDLFKGNLAGDDAPQWMGAYGEMQADILTTELARDLARSGKLGISEMLLRQWRLNGELDESPAGPEASPSNTEVT